MLILPLYSAIECNVIIWCLRCTTHFCTACPGWDCWTCAVPHKFVSVMKEELGGQRCSICEPAVVLRAQSLCLCKHTTGSEVWCFVDVLCVRPTSRRLKSSSRQWVVNSNQTTCSKNWGDNVGSRSYWLRTEDKDYPTQTLMLLCFKSRCIKSHSGATFLIVGLKVQKKKKGSIEPLLFSLCVEGLQNGLR